ncbi:MULTISPECIES: DMT family transporter [unclassified Pseudodesulfovibrio]|uniref:DMT family transporter n=1 Tax=unclassified Pseudodesulfovibrio TaxID=2661612 RepID=UPI000FEB69E2|nr:MULTISPECIES: DMT family transporter [unclassified Pseudodesulfovibrio]MCJ2165750.1 DMT family transporter [Pseudodesulfovibrio sp. S3-i]RWU02879.1 DMT family transporter [Pseudodesulfovibrio sp. S3]
MSQKSYAYINLSLAMILVGSSVVAGKIMVAELPIFLASALRFILALAILIPIVFMREGGLPRISRRSWLMIAGQSLCGSFLFTVFLLYGLTLTGPASAGIITSTTPACMGIIAWFFLKDRPSTRTGLGILLSVLGVLVINLVQGNGVTGANPLAGNLLVLCAVIFESLFLLIRKTVPEPLSPLAVSTIISLFGLLWFLPMGVIEAVSTDFTAISMTGWLVVLYYGAFVTVLAYLFWFAGITRVSPSTAGVFTAIMPVSALVLSALILDEPLGWQQLTGCGCVLGGIVLISK